MSNKTKRLAKGLGASALAVATIASGLSFGAASASAYAAPASAASTPSKDASAASTPSKEKGSERQIELIALLPDGRYAAYGARNEVRRFDTLEDAQTWALDLHVERVSASSFRLTDGDQCFAAPTYHHYWGDCGWIVKGRDATEFTQDERGNLVWDGDVNDASSKVKYIGGGDFVSGYALWTKVAEQPVNRFIGIQGLAFHGAVEATDVDDRSARLTGNAAANAFVEVSWGDGRAEEVRANADGEWSYELNGLKLGSNSVHLEQYVDQKKAGEYDLDVDLKIADLTVEHEFGAQLDDLVTLTGKAQPGAIVKALDEAGNMIVASDQVAASGSWSMELPAPNKAGARDVTVIQSYGGEDTDGTAVSIDYGKQLVMTRPEDGFQHPGGRLSATGLGEPGSVVTLHEGSKLLGSGTVLQSSQWNIRTTDSLSSSEHKLTVTQKSKGGNVQTETIVVNPGEGAIELTADGRFNAADSTKPAEAFGSAPKGSTVILRNSVGQEIGRTVASGDAYVIPIDPMKATSGTNTFSVIIEGAPESDAKSFTLNYGQPAAAVVVTKPAKNGTVEPGRIAFAGTGETGSKIVVRGSSRVVASGTVTAGAWSATSTVDLQKGSYDLYFDQIAKGGLTSTVRHAFTIGETAPIVTPHTVTSPAAGAVVDTLTPEFRGTGHEGATITVRGSSRVVATGTVQNGQWAAKTDPDAPLTPGTYNLYVVQSVRGTVTGTVRVAFTVSNEAFRELSLSAPAQGETVTVLRPTFVGTATPGAEITVASSRRTVATATVDEFGTFRATALFDLERGGSYPGLEVKQVTKTGKSSTTAAFFTVDRNAQ